MVLTSAAYTQVDGVYPSAAREQCVESAPVGGDCTCASVQCVECGPANEDLCTWPASGFAWDILFFTVDTQGKSVIIIENTSIKSNTSGRKLRSPPMC